MRLFLTMWLLSLVLVQYDVWAFRPRTSKFLPLPNYVLSIIYIPSSPSISLQSFTSVVLQPAWKKTDESWRIIQFGSSPQTWKGSESIINDYKRHSNMYPSLDEPILIHRSRLDKQTLSVIQGVAFLLQKDYSFSMGSMPLKKPRLLKIHLFISIK